MSLVNSYTSWQPLEEVIVGRAYDPDYFDFIDDAHLAVVRRLDPTGSHAASHALGYGNFALVLLQRNQLRDIIERRGDQNSLGYPAWLGVVGVGVF